MNPVMRAETKESTTLNLVCDRTPISRKDIDFGQFISDSYTYNDEDRVCFSPFSSILNKYDMPSTGPDKADVFLVDDIMTQKKHTLILTLPEIGEVYIIKQFMLGKEPMNKTYEYEFNGVTHKNKPLDARTEYVYMPSLATTYDALAAMVTRGAKLMNTITYRRAKEQSLPEIEHPEGVIDLWRSNDKDNHEMALLLMKTHNLLPYQATFEFLLNETSFKYEITGCAKKSVEVIERMMRETNDKDRALCRKLICEYAKDKVMKRAAYWSRYVTVDVKEVDDVGAV